MYMNLFESRKGRGAGPFWTQKKETREVFHF